jgi:mevalonate kinase
LRTGEYYSKGKFLISGEYLVLNGAKALSVPLKFGQSMKVSEISKPGIILWETYVMDKPWFQAGFKGSDMEITYFSDEKIALFIQKLLIAGSELRPGFFNVDQGYFIENRINFDINWGLGSSSSLVSNTANWLETDLLTLYRRLFNGSGYDVFCARAEGPLIYQLDKAVPVIENTSLPSSVTGCLYFVYLGQKQDSQESVRKFRETGLSDPELIQAVSELTLAMVETSEPEKFMELMRKHESLVSGILGVPPVKQELFPDFKGEIKSLGAWGGDFIMVCTFLDPAEVRDYFGGKGKEVVFSWKEIVYCKLNDET